MWSSQRIPVYNFIQRTFVVCTEIWLWKTLELGVIAHCSHQSMWDQAQSCLTWHSCRRVLWLYAAYSCLQNVIHAFNVCIGPLKRKEQTKIVLYYLSFNTYMCNSWMCALDHLKMSRNCCPCWNSTLLSEFEQSCNFWTLLYAYQTVLMLDWPISHVT